MFYCRWLLSGAIVSSAARPATLIQEPSVHYGPYQTAARPAYTHSASGIFRHFSDRSNSPSFEMLVLKSIFVVNPIFQVGTAIPLTVRVADASTCIEDVIVTTLLEYSSTLTSMLTDTKAAKRQFLSPFQRRAPKRAVVGPAAVSTSMASSSISSAASSASSINGSTTAPTSATLQAPQPDTPVPTDAAIYSTTGPDFDMTSFYS